MKRLILFIAMALLPVIVSAQDKHVYSFETGRYTIVTDMGMEGIYHQERSFRYGHNGRDLYH